jgi:hypothetical protein
MGMKGIVTGVPCDICEAALIAAMAPVGQTRRRIAVLACWLRPSRLWIAFDVEGNEGSSGCPFDQIVLRRSRKGVVAFRSCAKTDANATI